MKEFIGRVAVVTGAARGVGRWLAHRAASEGMCIVLADTNDVALRDVAKRLRKSGAEVISVPTDGASNGLGPRWQKGSVRLR